MVRQRVAERGSHRLDLRIEDFGQTPVRGIACPNDATTVSEAHEAVDIRTIVREYDLRPRRSVENYRIERGKAVPRGEAIGTILEAIDRDRSKGSFKIARDFQLSPRPAAFGPVEITDRILQIAGHAGLIAFAHDSDPAALVGNVGGRLDTSLLDGPASHPIEIDKFDAQTVFLGRQPGIRRPLGHEITRNGNRSLGTLDGPGDDGTAPLHISERAIVGRRAQRAEVGAVAIDDKQSACIDRNALDLGLEADFADQLRIVGPIAPIDAVVAIACALDRRERNVGSFEIAHRHRLTAAGKRLDNGEPVAGGRDRDILDRRQRGEDRCLTIDLLCAGRRRHQRQGAKRNTGEAGEHCVHGKRPPYCLIQRLEEGSAQSSSQENKY